MKRKTRNTILGILASAFVLVGFAANAFATVFLTVSPPYEKISLIPGQSTKATFKISSPANSSGIGKYKLSVSPFSINGEDNSAIFENNGDYNKIVDWITLDWEEGELEPNQTVEVGVQIDTPIDAPAGGQYAAILVSSDNNDVKEDEFNIQNYYQIAHLIYADVAGETIRKGDISNVSLTSFLFSGNITAGAVIRNDGNVHSNALHTLKILPLFGDEEYYTNEEGPEQTLIMPNGTRYASISWDKTPPIGIFRASYKVEFEGVKREVSRLVIVCPLWLLFVIALIIVILAGWFVFGKRKKDDL